MTLVDCSGLVSPLSRAIEAGDVESKNAMRTAMSLQSKVDGALESLGAAADKYTEGKQPQSKLDSSFPAQADQAFAASCISTAAD